MARPKKKNDLSIEKPISELIKVISEMSESEQIEAINLVKTALHEISPFKNEPVDCILWVKHDTVVANDYNPNTVAPPEMKLLALSIEEDGYTQPIVTWRVGEVNEVIDGFHRNRCGKEIQAIQERIKGYLPIVSIKSGKTEREDRIASTIRHNRARGKHGIDSMSSIVVELKKRNRSDEWIGKHLGMDPDEVLRLSQISGLAELFADKSFSQAWDLVGDLSEDELRGEFLDETVD